VVKVGRNAAELSSWAPKNWLRPFRGPQRSLFLPERSSGATGTQLCGMLCRINPGVYLQLCPISYVPKFFLRPEWCSCTQCTPGYIWQPVTYVKSWLALNRRPADCTQCPERSISIHHASDGMKSLWDIL